MVAVESGDSLDKCLGIYFPEDVLEDEDPVNQDVVGVRRLLGQPAVTFIPKSFTNEPKVTTNELVDKKRYPRFLEACRRNQEHAIEFVRVKDNG